MEHAEAHERLSDLSLEPGRLARLEDDPSSEIAALRAHLTGCERCAADLASWRRTWAEAGVAWRADDDGDPGPAGIGSGAADLPIRPPAHLRQRILDAIRADSPGPGQVAVPIGPGAAPVAARDAEAELGVAAGGDASSSAAGEGRRARPRRVVRPWWVAAAASLVAVVAVTAGWLRTAEVEQLRSEAAELAAAVATLDRVLATEPNWTVTLRAADGQPGGTLAWSQQEVVVITSGLPAPGPGQAYRCWLEMDGTRSPMGEMAFSRSTGYWAGAQREYGPGLRPGGSFGVSLVQAGGGGTPVLVGQL
jgi:hypothetical protein